MRIKLEIVGLDTIGDAVRVKAQGNPDHAATWRQMDIWTFTVPVHTAKRYTIGRTLIVTLEAAKARIGGR